MFTPQPVGYMSTPYKQASEIPKGLGAKHEAEGALEVLHEFELGLTDIEGFSHLILIWEFDRSEGFQLLGTPPSDNRPHGVFATRSPRRPNPIGLTVVELLRREGRILHVRGVDMLDGTPVLDIKPYLSSIPPETLRRGWLAEAETRQTLIIPVWLLPFRFGEGIGNGDTGVWQSLTRQVLSATEILPTWMDEKEDRAQRTGCLTVEWGGCDCCPKASWRSFGCQFCVSVAKQGLCIPAKYGQFLF